MRKQRLVIEQLDKKLLQYKTITTPPSKGWIHTIRTALRMSLRQLSQRLGINISSAREIEEREKNGSVTIKTLREAAKAMNMKLVYALIPVDGTLESMIDQKALAIAQEIVMRTANTMKLEDQAVSKKRLQQSIKQLASEIKDEMPRYLWD